MKRSKTNRVLSQQVRTRASGPQRVGAAAVEFALTAPLLFLLLFGSLELSHANMVFNVAEAAAYEGAREGIIPGATVAECQASAQRLLDIARIRGAQIQVTPANLAINSDDVQVQVSIPYQQNTIVAPFFTRNLNIQRACTLSREQL